MRQFHIRSLRASPRAAVILALVAQSATSQAQSLPIGEALYGSICIACHNANPLLDPRVGAAASSPAALTNAISTIPEMRVAVRPFLTQQDIKDVATFIGNPRGVPLVASTETERIMNWAEWKYQTFLLPRTTTQPIEVYSVRYYSAADFYVGMANGRVYTYSPKLPNARIDDIGSTASFLDLVRADGF